MQRPATISAGSIRSSTPNLQRTPEAKSWDATIESLYLDHFDSLCRSARRLLDTTQAAEETVQEAFLRFVSLTNRPSPGYELSYLRSIVMNEARSTLRRRVVAQRHRCVMLDVAAVDETADQAIVDDDSRWLRQHLGGLSDRQQQVLTMRYLRGLSERETAEALSISTGSVKTHSSRAMAAIRKSFGVAA